MSSTPGETLLTRILGAHALASDRARWIAADLETAYALRRRAGSQRVSLVSGVATAQHVRTILLPLGMTPAIDAEMTKDALVPPSSVVARSRCG